MWVLEKFSYLAGTLLEYSYLYYLGTTQEIVIKGGELICSHLHYWKRVLCRGPEALPRAKYRALGKETLCRGPDTGALGKERPSAKRPLPRVRPSAKTGPRQIKSLPRASALGKDTLGKVGPLGHGGHFPSNFAEGHPLGPRQRFGKFFFKSLPRAPDQALGKDFLKTSFRPNFFFINRLCRGPEARPSAKRTFAEGQDRPSAKIFYF